MPELELFRGHFQCPINFMPISYIVKNLMKNIIFFSILIFCCDSFSQNSKKPVKIENKTEAIAKEKIRYLQIEAIEDTIFNHRDLWSGYDFEAIATAVKSARSKKGDFESKEEFSERQKRAFEQPIYGLVGVNSRIAIVVPEIKKRHDMRAVVKDGLAQVGYIYDAESKILKICASGQVFKSSQLGYSVESVVFSKTKSSEYIAQNSYGAKVIVSSIVGEDITVAVSTGNQHHCSIQVEVDNTVAQEFLNSSGIVILGHLKSPYFETSRVYGEASITDPIEINIAVTRLLFVPEKIFLLNRDSRKIIQASDW